MSLINTASATTTAPEVVGSDAGAHNGREARNLAEKHRRDKLNASIQELATMVPHVAEATRRLDKTAVLRFATHGLRLQHVFGKSAANNRCAYDEFNEEPQAHLTDRLMQLLESFFITLTCHGQIVLVSASVEQLLGHCQSDLYGQNILNITHLEDQELLRQQLIPRDMEALFRKDYQTHTQHRTTSEVDQTNENAMSDSQDYCSKSSPSSNHTREHLVDIDASLRADRRCFTVRLARASSRADATRSYEAVKIDGCFRRSDCSTTAGNFPIVSQLIRRSRSNGNSGMHGGPNLQQHDAIAQAALHGISGNDVVLVAMASVIRLPKILNRLLDANKLEYRTRHLIDGRIIDCDQRIGLVAGYMTDEVCNLSPFSFMHQDDVRWVIVALRRMYDCNNDYGESCYRLLSRNGHFIYLQSKGFLEIDQSTNEVHSFVCINTLLDEEEGRRKIQEMKNKFSIIINTKIPSNSMQDVPASQNPQQLERIVLYLIENLQKRDEATAEATLSNLEHTRFANTPPLALVPPEPASVKNSISKSVNIVNDTAAKNLHYSLKSPASDASLSPSPPSSIDLSDEHLDNNSGGVAVQRPCVLQITKLAPMLPALIESTSSRSNSTSSSSSSICSLSSPTEQPPQKFQHQISVLKRVHSTTSTANTAVDIITPAKRTAPQTKMATAATLMSATTNSKTDAALKIHTVISNPLNFNDPKTCKRQPVSMPVSKAVDRQVDGGVIIQQQKKKKIIINIKSEYDVPL